VDEGRGLQGLTGPLLGEARRGHAAQFLINQRQQVFGGTGLAPPDRGEHLGYIVQSTPMCHSFRRISNRWPPLAMPKAQVGGRVAQTARRQGALSPARREHPQISECLGFRDV
jgi:hypothetical protein